MSYQAIVAADTAVREMRQLRDDVQRQRTETEKKFAAAIKENKEATQKALAEAKAKRDAAESGRVAPRPVQEVREEKYTFFDSEDDYNPPAAPSFQMPEVTPPPRPTPRRASRPVYDDDDDDYSNQSWME
ncbi:hypothetical protein [Kutzneria sp. CA-103260]|uniref:hypothetical protein n=1 Tax=Kutzneria sp. CA-103260 TaxID=2802641 RepID=UPI001BA48066|nr:hypothetical protein [Kutzneria sp. CA-103260]QUQ70683.1 hypothetical protein JJ691_84660 [Kutzneria sp. CA-103260]